MMTCSTLEGKLTSQCGTPLKSKESWWREAPLETKVLSQGEVPIESLETCWCGIAFKALGTCLHEATL
jgi:hypothetical protein